MIAEIYKCDIIYRMSEVLKDLSLPYDLATAQQMAAEFGTPLHVYDQAGIERTAEQMRAAFAWNPHYRNFFAVKATPRLELLDVLHEKGMGFDCSSETELLHMRTLGVSGDDIFFTSNNTQRADFELAIELGATVNIDDLTQVPVFLEALGDRRYDRVALRYNPGRLKKGNELIGKPEEAKYGLRIDQLVPAFRMLMEATIESFGLHTMVASNEREAAYFAETASILLDAVDEVEREGGPTIDFVNLGGGFGLNYRPDQAPFDPVAAAEQIRQVFAARGRSDMEVVTENGRFVTGNHGSLLTRVVYDMEKHKQFLTVDASMHNLMRPGMYGAYHHVTILGKENEHPTRVVDISGALCENNDKFAVDRAIPHAEPGDLLVIHDTGAHGSAMGFGYNGLRHCAEVVIRPDGKIELIREAEPYEDVIRREVWRGSTGNHRSIRVS